MDQNQDLESIEAAMKAAGDAGNYAEAQRLQKKYERERAKAERQQAAAPAPGATTRQTESARRARRASAKDTAAEAAKKRLTTIAGVSIAVAIASVGISGWIAARSAATIGHVEGNQVAAVVATRDIPAGTTLAEGDLELGKVPGDYSPADATAKVSDLLGKKTITDQTKGMAVSSSSVATSPDPASLPTAIADGCVGIMVALEPANGLSPLSSVGDYVDVVGGTTDGVVAATSMLAENVRILALDSSLTGSGEEGYQYVTVEVTKDQAMAISAAQNVRLLAKPAAPEEGAKDAQ